MKIHHLRNATFVIESKDHHILIDPMLGGKGAFSPFAYSRHKPKRNPTVSLPDNAADILDKVTHCLITHSQKFGIKALQHKDHLDHAGTSFLRDKNIPVVTRKQDVSYLAKQGLNICLALNDWQTARMLDGEITAVPAQHGHGWIHNLMANGVGLYIQLPDEPSVYISGDTVYTKDVERALVEFKPDLAVVASGGASLDVGGPILMPMTEIVTFVLNAPGKVVANHLEALNHCQITRQQLKMELESKGLISTVFIPNDGETLTIGL